jgi:hypothetical protein
MTIFDPVIHFFKMVFPMLGHKIWLSAPKSFNISVPYILFLTLNWGYDDARQCSVDQAIALEAYWPNCKKHGQPEYINCSMARPLYVVHLAIM